MSATVEAEKTSVSGLSVEEMSESLTGFDEIAIAKLFGKEIGDLPGTRPLRALVMVWHKRAGLDDGAAYEAAMGLSMKGVMGFFEDDVDPDVESPESPSGKEGSPVG